MYILISIQLLHVARPRFYAIDDLGNEETSTLTSGNSPSQTNRDHKEQRTCHQRDRQQRPEAKNSIQFRNVTVVKTYPADKSATTETVEEMRRLLTSIRRRVSSQYPGSSFTSQSG